MNLNIKTKIILNVALVIICSILLFTAIVSVMLWEQTERKAHTSILSAVNIVAERLQEKSLNLKDTAAKIASTAELANLANFIQETRDIKSMQGMIKNERKSLAISLYSIALTTGIPQISIFGTNERWICHIDISKNSAQITIPDSKSDKYLQAEIVKGNTLLEEDWKEVRIAPIPSHIQSPYPQVPQSSVIEAKNRLWITAQAPLLISTIDVSTLREQSKQIGAINLRVPFGNSFTNDIFKLTNLKTNLYINNKYIAGNIPAQETINPGLSNKTQVNTFDTLLTNKTSFDVATIYEQAYFRGITPLASNGKVLGHFALFLSQQETRSDLNHIVKTLLLAAIIIIVFSVVASLVTAKSIAKPILELIRIMRQVEEKGDFSIRAKSDGISEIALAGRAFNSLIEELQSETSNRKTAENKLADNSVAIEDQIASRTNELERKTHELSRSNRNISNFLMTMSHEIRTPMNGAKGMLKLLSETDLSAEQQELIDITNTSNNSLVTVVDDVLELSQIASGKLAIENIPFDIRVLIEDILEILEEKAKVKMLDLDYLISAEIPQKVNGDPTKLRQILNHLISNTIKFTEQGEIMIYVSATDGSSSPNTPISNTRGLDGELNIKFEIHDSGVRPDQARKQLFDSIDLATGENKLRPEETGLGISICNQLVNKLGGNFEITRDDEGGSCFVIELPFDQLAEDDKTIEIFTDLADKKLLLVDSIPANSLIIQQHLMQWGIEFQATSSEAEAKTLLLEAYKSNIPFDLILIDIQSPQIQGVKLSSWISSNQNLAQTKQVLITLSGFKGDANIASGAGISGYLSTPIRASQLHQCLSMVFGLKHSSSENLVTKHSIREINKAKATKILLIDKDLKDLKQLSATAKSFGVNADICISSEKTSKYIAANNYALIFINAEMPIINAAELTQIIKKMGGGKNKTPIYATAGTRSNINEKEITSSGIAGVMRLPVERAELKHILSTHLDIEKLTNSADINNQRKQIMLQNAPESLDIDTILALRSLIPVEEMEQFILGFFTSCQKRINNLELAYETSDDHQLIFITHTLKRSCANMGAMKISGLCHLLEHHFSNNGFDSKIPQLISKIDAEIDKLKETLPKELGVL